MEVEGGEEGEGELERTLIALESIWLLMQKAEPGGKTLIDD